MRSVAIIEKISILIAVTVLLIYSLACQTFMGTPNTNIPIDDGGLDSPTLPPPWIREEIPRQAESPIIPCLMMRSISMVFDGHESSKAITVQGVDLGDGTINISITLSDF